MIKIIRYCDCGNYSPISTKGVILTNCKNCGGMYRPIMCGPIK